MSAHRRADRATFRCIPGAQTLGRCARRAGCATQPCGQATDRLVITRASGAAAIIMGTRELKTVPGGLGLSVFDRVFARTVHRASSVGMRRAAQPAIIGDVHATYDHALHE